VGEQKPLRAARSDGAFVCGPCSPLSSGRSSDFCGAQLDHPVESNFWLSANAVKEDILCRGTWNEHIRLPIPSEHQCRAFAPQPLPHRSADAHLQLTQRLSLLLSALILGDSGSRGSFSQLDHEPVTLFLVQSQRSENISGENKRLQLSSLFQCPRSLNWC